jgi:hypothetical protein
MGRLTLQTLHNLKDSTQEFRGTAYYIAQVSSLVEKEVIEWERWIKNHNENEVEGEVERKTNYTQYEHQ